jgi:hypothetical protein
MRSVRQEWLRRISTGPYLKTPSTIDHQGRVLLGFTVRENDGLARREHPVLSIYISRFTRHGELDLALVLPTIAGTVRKFVGNCLGLTRHGSGQRPSSLRLQLRSRTHVRRRAGRLPSQLGHVWLQFLQQGS